MPTESTALGMRLVTGDAGFVGCHALQNWPQAVGLAQCAGQAVDIRDKAALLRVLAKIAPKEVLHLAGISFVPDALKNPRLTYEVEFSWGRSIYWRLWQKQASQGVFCL